MWIIFIPVIFGIPLIILTIKTKFKVPRILAIFGMLFLCSLFVARIFPYNIVMILFIIGFTLGVISYFINTIELYKLDKNNIEVIIKTIRNVWIEIVIIQIFLSILTILASASNASINGGFYGSISSLSIPGIIAGLIFFNQLIKKKNWARIALGVLGTLGILSGITGLGVVFKLESIGLICALLGCLFSIGWSLLLVIFTFGNKNIKTYVSEANSIPEV